MEFVVSTHFFGGLGKIIMDMILRDSVIPLFSVVFPAEFVENLPGNSAKICALLGMVSENVTRCSKGEVES